MTVNNDLKALLTELQQHCAGGNRKALLATLREIMNNRLPYYHTSVTDGLEYEFGDSLYKILLLELDEEEEDSIETAELAYLSLSTVFHRNEGTPEQYKSRFMLLHYFSDYFTDAIIEIFLKKYKEYDRLEARRLAIECLEKMQLSDIFRLEENYPDFINTDEQLNDACNRIHIAPELSDEDLKDAVVLHQVLNAYLKVKYKR